MCQCCLDQEVAKHFTCIRATRHGISTARKIPLKVLKLVFPFTFLLLSKVRQYFSDNFQNTTIYADFQNTAINLK